MPSRSGIQTLRARVNPAGFRGFWFWADPLSPRSYQRRSAPRTLDVLLATVALAPRSAVATRERPLLACPPLASLRVDGSSGSGFASARQGAAPSPYSLTVQRLYCANVGLRRSAKRPR